MNQEWRLFQSVFNSQSSYVLATILKTQGSTYRKAGAMMLIEGEHCYGLLSGGCLEEDIKAHGKQCLLNRKQSLIHYNLKGDDDLLWGLGVGCDGSLDILLQPLTPDNNHLNFSNVLAMIRDRQDGYWIQSFSRCQQTNDVPMNIIVSRMAFAEQSVLVHSSTQIDEIFSADSHDISMLNQERVESVEAVYRAELEKQELEKQKLNKNEHSQQINVREKNIQVKQTAIKQIEPARQYLITPVRAPIQLLICGAGPDALPLIKIAKTLGWDVTVWDHRQGYLDSVASHEQCTLKKQRASLVAVEEVAPFDAVVIMTHHIEHDQHYLSLMLKSTLAYIGLLGPSKRKQRLLNALSIDEVEVNHRVFGPVGLDIHANSPASIAVSIVSQIQQNLFSRNL